MNDSTNLSRIPSSYTPSNYARARFAGSPADAASPVPRQDDVAPQADD